jgi:phosphatidylinositol 4-phosphatase
MEAVDLMVDMIRRAAEDLGNPHANIVQNGDVVTLAIFFSASFKKTLLTLLVMSSLLDAQRMTSVYAKMEYGVKRLLWLGG